MIMACSTVAINLPGWIMNLKICHLGGNWNVRSPFGQYFDREFLIVNQVEFSDFSQSY